MTEAPRPRLARPLRGVPSVTARPVDTAMIVWMASLSGLWGLNAITIKAVTTGMAPMLAAGLRGAVALVLLVAWGAWRRERLWFHGRLAAHSLAVGLLFAGEFVLFYTGASMTSGGHVAIYINVAPFFVAAGAHVLLPGDRMTWLRWAGLALAFAGIAVLFSGDLLGGQLSLWRGDLLVIAGAAVWASTTLYIKRFMVAGMSGFELLYVQIAVSTPVLLVLAALVHPGALADIAPLAWGIVLFQGIVVVFFSYLAWMNLLRVYPASAMQSFTFLTPVWGVALGALMLGEHVTGATFAAIALVGVGLYLVNRPPRAA
jgi:drug/metabolite transporter (DMT)-like permease